MQDYSVSFINLKAEIWCFPSRSKAPVITLYIHYWFIYKKCLKYTNKGLILKYYLYYTGAISALFMSWSRIVKMKWKYLKCGRHLATFHGWMWLWTTHKYAWSRWKLLSCRNPSKAAGVYTPCCCWVVLFADRLSGVCSGAIVTGCLFGWITAVYTRYGKGHPATTPITVIASWCRSVTFLFHRRFNPAHKCIALCECRILFMLLLSVSRVGVGEGWRVWLQSSW